MDSHRPLHLALLSLLALGAAPAAGQSYLRGIGANTFDTSLLDATDFAAVFAGKRHTLAVRTNGSVVAWGTERPVHVPDFPLPVLKVATRSYTALALLSDGTIQVWGSGNYYGQENVPPLPAGLTYVDCAVLTYSGAAIRSDGQLVAWGYNLNGVTNVPPLPAGTAYVAVSAGYQFFAALRSDGAVVAWGLNGVGQTNVPTPPPGVSYVAVSCGEAHGLALRSDGRIDTWGDNGSGQLNVPALPAGTTYVQADAGGNFGLAIRSDGAVIGWGDNSHGQLGVPALPAGVAAVEVSAGDQHAGMRRSDGKVISWGSSQYFEQNFASAATGQLPIRIDADEYGAAVLFDDGTAVTQGDPISNLPPAPAGLGYVAVSRDSGRAAAVRTDGALVATPNVPQLPTPPAGVAYVDADVFGYGVAALRSDGQVASAGTIFNGLPPPPAGLSYVEIEAGLFLTGRLSNGEVVAQPTQGIPPPALPAGLEYVEIATGLSHGFCRRSDGELVGFGSGYYANGAPPVAPPPLPAGVTYVEVAAGHTHTVARRSNGTIVAWESSATTAAGPERGSVVPEATGLPNATYNTIGAGKLATVAVIGPTSTYVTFAPGCAGSLPSARLIPEDTPKLGRDLIVRLFDLPLGLAVLAAGFSNTTAPFGPLPASAAPIGMPGCTIHVSPEFTAVVGSPGAAGPAVYTLPIPNNLALLGVTFYQQAIVPDPGANAAGLVLSDATEAVVGR